MKNLKIIIALSLGLFVNSMKAQSQKTNNIKEYGIGFTGLNNFSLQYRWGNENRLYRISGNFGGHTSFGNSTTNASSGDTLNKSYTSNDSKNKIPVDLNFSVAISKLRLKFINEQFGLMYGPNIGLGYQYSTYNATGTGIISNNNNYPLGTFPNDQKSSRTAHTLLSNIGLVIGAVYKINASFLLYAEITPSVFYTYTNSYANSSINNSRFYTDNQTISNNSFGISNLSNSGAMLTLVYRITK